MPESKPDEITDVDEYYSVSPAEFIECRLFGHRFRPTHKGYLVEGDDPKRPDALIKKLQCTCGLPAIDRFHPYTLERVGSRYTLYAAVPGYLAKGTRLTRTEVRLAEAAAYGFGERAKLRTRGGRRKRAR